MPWVVLLVLGVLVFTSALLGRTRFGRYVYAIGGNEEAARLSGIAVRRTKLAAYALCAAFAALAGVIARGRREGRRRLNLADFRAILKLMF